MLTVLTVFFCFFLLSCKYETLLLLALFTLFSFDTDVLFMCLQLLRGIMVMKACLRLMERLVLCLCTLVKLSYSGVLCDGKAYCSPESLNRQWKTWFLMTFNQNHGFENLFCYSCFHPTNENFLASVLRKYSWSF